MRIWLAVRCFFSVLLSAEFAHRLRQLEGDAPAANEPEAKPSPPATAPESKRSDAITLLATLQREARFIDIVTEPLDGYSDAQIGAAARDVLRDAGKAINRLFALRRVVDSEEGDKIEVPASYDSGRYRLTGSVAGEPPFTGQLTHSGWEATTCDLPAWTGSQQAALVVAPAEVQMGG